MRNYLIHSYHLVDESPWPFVSALRALFFTTGSVAWFWLSEVDLIIRGLCIIFLSMLQWWQDVSREGRFQGSHTNIVEIGLRWGIGLFIISEIFFFLSFFWAFFHRRLRPNVEIGRTWPPIGVEAFNPWQVPLLNTIILLSSGVTVTWRHHEIIQDNHDAAIKSLLTTIILGIYFTFLQGYEYYESSFSFRDRAYGSTFFIATGFHGIHVLVGTSFLFVCYLRLIKGQFRRAHHFGFEAAAWYWHFVDVVWLFLFVSIYWWGGF